MTCLDCDATVHTSAAPAVGGLVKRLRDRAKVAREELTGTSLGDALHFEEAANEIERLSAQPASPLRSAAERVCWFDWSDNDMDAVAAIEALRKAVTSYAAAQPQYLANCKHSVSQCETYGQCLGVDCKNADMAIVHRLCVEPKQDGIIYPEVDS